MFPRSQPLVFYLLLLNFSCHFPLAADAGAAAPSVSPTSSIVSWTVATELSAAAGGDGCDAKGSSSSWASRCPSVPADAAVPSPGASRISALDVFFCRSEYVLSWVLRSAAVGEDVSVRLWGGVLAG